MKKHLPLLLVLWFTFVSSEFAQSADSVARRTLSPDAKVIRPFNGMDFTGLTTWLKESGKNDPHNDYLVENGMLRIRGQGMGYIATADAYKDYHLVVDYKWGDRTDGSGNVRNSGILLHAIGPDGNARGVWMTSIECQLAQGCEGDLIVIRGKDEDGETIPATITSDTVIADDGRTRWKAGGQPTVYNGKQFWWSEHEVGFAEKLDTRGKHDVASPLGEWTRVECICRGHRITVKINGIKVNECYNVYPSSGNILLENEGNEIYFRNLELRPIGQRRSGFPAVVDEATSPD